MKNKQEKRWLSSYDECDICHGPVKGKVPWFVDGKTTMGPWGLLCPKCFTRYGTGLGCGLGQRYDGFNGVLLEGGCKESDTEGYEP